MATHAHTTPPPARRDFVRALGATALGTIGALGTGVATTRHPDAALIRLGQDLGKAQGAIAAYEALPRHRRSDEKLAAVMEPAFALANEIAECRAATLDGLLVQVRAIRWCRSGDPFDEDALGFTTDTSIAAAIISGLWAMSGGIA